MNRVCFRLGIPSVPLSVYGRRMLPNLNVVNPLFFDFVKYDFLRR